MARTLRLKNIALAIPEQRRVQLDFPRAGPFGPLGRPKDMIKRLKENISEQLRLMTAIEYNGERKRGYPTAFTTLSVLLATNLGSPPTLLKLYSLFRNPA